MYRKSWFRPLIQMETLGRYGRELGVRRVHVSPGWRLPDKLSACCLDSESPFSHLGEPMFALARDLLKEAKVPLGAAYALRDPARLRETVRERRSWRATISSSSGWGRVGELDRGPSGRERCCPGPAARGYRQRLRGPLKYHSTCETPAIPLPTAKSSTWIWGSGRTTT
jgi:hypothetical protein